MTKVFCLLLVLGLIALTQQYRHKRSADTRKYGIGIGSNWQQKRAVGNWQQKRAAPTTTTTTTTYSPYDQE